MVYPLLLKHRGVDCVLSLPEDIEVSIYLKSLGLFRVLLHDALQEGSLGAANIYPWVSMALAELATNAVQHSESPIAAYGFVQYHESASGPRFMCGVADGGIGIRRSLEKNPSLRDRISYDWDAIELAVREHISGTLESSRGFGLNWVSEDMRRTGRRLVIHSGQGVFQITEDMQSGARRASLFPGTLAYASIPT